MREEIVEYDEIDYRIRIGQTAQENWDLISDSSQNDLWFHLEKHPSPHVVIETPNKIKKIPKRVISRAAELCVEYSKQVHGYVIYTEIKNVKKSEKVGSVTTRKTTRLLL